MQEHNFFHIFFTILQFSAISAKSSVCNQKHKTLIYNKKGCKRFYTLTTLVAPPIRESDKAYIFGIKGFASSFVCKGTIFGHKLVTKASLLPINILHFSINCKFCFHDIASN